VTSRKILSTEQFLRATGNFFQASRIKNQLLFGYIYLLDGNITDSIRLNMVPFILKARIHNNISKLTYEEHIDGLRSVLPHNVKGNAFVDEFF